MNDNKCNLHCRYFYVLRSTTKICYCELYKKKLNDINKSITDNCKFYEHMENKKQ